MFINILFTLAMKKRSFTFWLISCRVKCTNIPLCCWCIYVIFHNVGPRKYIGNRSNIGHFTAVRHLNNNKCNGVTNISVIKAIKSSSIWWIHKIAAYCNILVRVQIYKILLMVAGSQDQVRNLLEEIYVNLKCPFSFLTSQIFHSISSMCTQIDAMQINHYITHITLLLFFSKYYS